MKFSFTGHILEKKLVLITMIPLVVVSIVFLLAVTITQINTQQDALTQSSSSVSGILSRSVAAAVLFRDMEAAKTMLESLQYVTSAKYAYVVSTDGAFEVEYDVGQRKKNWRAMLSNDTCLKEDLRLFSDYLVCVKPVEIDGEEIGTLTLVFDARSVRNAAGRFVLLLIALFIASSIVTFAMVKQLHLSILVPVRHLRDAMQTVSRKNDYTIRVGDTTEEDMRELYRGFDHMLDQIESREKELDSYRKGLEVQIEERTAEIETINARRIEWLENMTFFLHHELRNKIVGFRSTLDIIERRAKGIDLEKYLNRARKSATLMNHLLQSVGNASDLEASLFTELKRPLNLSALIKEQEEEYISSFPEQNFQSELEPDIMINGNPERIIQVLDKLVSNAIEHSDKGSAISIRLFSENSDVHLEITNFGDALPDDSDEMFEVFVSSKLDKDQNRGLGLFVVRLVVHNHAGEVSAYPVENGQGARFVIRIPLYNRPGSH